MYFKLVLIVGIIGLSACNKRSDSKKAASFPSSSHAATLGLPTLEVPEDNPITKEKVALGERLYNDVRFSSTGTISCATCHAVGQGFTDSPLRVSKGIKDLEGTRNSPTIINSAFNRSQFWDGRSPDLEDQALHPFTNPVEMGLPNHEPIIEIVRNDPSYIESFKTIFDKDPAEIDIKDVTKAIATFERTIIAGNSRFDRWYFQDEDVMTEDEIEGFNVFIGNGRCVSCHMVEHTSALFTDHNFHNIGVGINGVPMNVIDKLTNEFLIAQYNRDEVDVKVLQEVQTSELGRFAVNKDLTHIGAFKTPTLRNIDITAPYMHDGSLKTLEEVVEHYNLGGASSEDEVITPFLSGGIRPLNLTEKEKANLVAFMKALTSEQFENNGGEK